LDFKDWIIVPDEKIMKIPVILRLELTVRRVVIYFRERVDSRLQRPSLRTCLIRRPRAGKDRFLRVVFSTRPRNAGWPLGKKIQKSIETGCMMRGRVARKAIT
jgi:hypothetical protein